MRKLLLLLLLPAIVQAQTYNQFKPANGILKGSTSTYATTAATSADVDGLYAAPVALTGADINTSNQVTATHLSGPLPATQGGTGQTTITIGDLLYGSSSNVLSKLAGNTTTTKQFLSQTGDGTTSAAPVWGALTAGDFQGLSPVWAGNQEIADAEPRYIFTETDQGSDLKKWDLDLNAAVLCFRTRTDADAAGQNVICATRGTTTALTNITLGYSVAGTYTFPFTGAATFSGSISTTSVSATGNGYTTPGRYLITGGNSASGTGMYSHTTNALDFSINGSQAGGFGTNGVWLTVNGEIQQIRVITASGAVTAATSDRHICVNKTTGAATTVNLFATPSTGTILTVDDCKGDAATNNITVAPNAGNIDGSATYVINTNYGSWTGIYTGTIWKTEASR
jgi:hypothetical protein